MSIDIVMQFSTIVATLILGVLTKKFDIIESYKIPYQNVIIGILAGLIAFLVGIYDNVLVAILTCFYSAMSAGGIYDTIKTKKKVVENESIE